MKAPPIIGILFGFGFLYGVWLLEPRWITGALALILLYLALTQTDRLAILVGEGDSGLAKLIHPIPPAAGGHVTNR